MIPSGNTSMKIYTQCPPQIKWCTWTHNMTNVEIAFNDFLQRNLEFRIDGKLVKEGKLVLINQRDFYINLYLKMDNNEKKKYEIPYPFKIYSKDNILTLEYTISSFGTTDHNIKYRLLSLNKKTNSKLYNNKLVISEKTP